MMKLRVFVRQSGFYDCAVAAPTLKAARQLFGVSEHDFKHFAKETTDKSIVAAALASPGEVLQRPVGTKKPFKLDPDKPSLENLIGPAKKIARVPSQKEKPSKASRRDKELEKQRRQYAAAAAKHAREAEQEEKLRKAKDAKLNAALEQHEKNMARLEKQRRKIDDQIEAERQRWEKQKRRLTN